MIGIDKRIDALADGILAGMGEIPAFSPLWMSIRRPGC